MDPIIFLGVKGRWLTCKGDNLNRSSGKCWSLNVSQHCGPPQPVTLLQGQLSLPLPIILEVVHNVELLQTNILESGPISVIRCVREEMGPVFRYCV
jgi:hypothetical protein